MSDVITLYISLPTGDPYGIRTVKRKVWTETAHGFPRSDWTEARSQLDLNKKGFYILWNKEASEPKTRVYIGQSSNIKERLSGYNSDKNVRWQESNDVIVGTHANLPDAHKYIEASLYDRAKRHGRCEVMNGQRPGGGDIDLDAQPDYDLILGRYLRYLPILGIDVFHARKSTRDPGGQDGGELTEEKVEVWLRRPRVSARGWWLPESQNKLLVVAGSQARLKMPRSFAARSSPLFRLRESLIEDGTLTRVDGWYRFSRDYPFRSVSAATSIITGNSGNAGYHWWKDRHGRTLDRMKKGAEGAGQEVRSAVLSLSGSPGDASGQLLEDGRFLILKGSEARLDVAKRLPQSFPGYFKLRETLIREKVLVRDGDRYRFARDHEFDSAAAATTVLRGIGGSRYDYWMDGEGRTLRQIKDSQRD